VPKLIVLETKEPANPNI